MPARRSLLLLLTLASAFTCNNLVFAEDSIRVTKSDFWIIADSENFRFRTQDERVPLAKIARHCETLRLQLQRTWMGPDQTDSWIPRCDVILHTTLQSYRRTLGNGVGRSVGCASLKIDSGRVVQRRIDIRLDSPSWQIDALPHELTHIVLADSFTARRIPPWIDEGIGVLSESRSKQSERIAVLQKSHARGDVLPLSQLLELKRFPEARYRDSFYGQSACLIHVLRKRSGNASTVIEFARHAQRAGYDSALREVYDIDGLQELKTIVENEHYQPQLGADGSDETVADSAAGGTEYIYD